MAGSAIENDGMSDDGLRKLPNASGDDAQCLAWAAPPAPLDGTFYGTPPTV